MTLPVQLAASTTPALMAAVRRPVIRNSRVKTRVTAQAETTPWRARPTMAAVTSTLSTKGSRRAPRFVAWLKRRAM
ncbi:hypothetical protein D3C86_1830830 [compost metagenome]